MDITSWGYSLSEIQGLFSRKQQRVVLADVSRRNKTGCVFGWSIEILRRRPFGQLKWVFLSMLLYHDPGSSFILLWSPNDLRRNDPWKKFPPNWKCPRPTIARWPPAWISPRRRRKRRIRTWVKVFGGCLQYLFIELDTFHLSSSNKS